MRHVRIALVLVGLVVISATVGVSIALQQAEVPPEATVKDIMTSRIGLNADYMWEAVATVVGPTGVTERTPQTDQEWGELRKRAVTLIDATNALAAPGIRVANPGEKPGNPTLQLPPEEIQELINGDRANWVARTRGLYDAAQKLLMAVDAKDSNVFRRAGADLYRACESCHIDYWYKKTGR